MKVGFDSFLKSLQNFIACVKGEQTPSLKQAYDNFISQQFEEAETMKQALRAAKPPEAAPASNPVNSAQ